MSDLNELMGGVDHVPFSGDWDAVERRASSVEPVRAPTRPHAVRTVAILAATLLVLGVAFYGLSGLGSSTDGAGTGPTPENSSTATYIDPAGIPITVDHPTDWFARSFKSSADGLSKGVEIANVEAITLPKDPAGQPQPSNYVAVTISASKEQVASSLPDSTLPLSMDDASVTLGPGNTRQLMARVGGVPIVIQVSAGPNASDADLVAADAIVASIRPNGSNAPPSQTAPPSQHLVITGAFTTNSAEAFPGSGRSCSLDGDTLILQTNAMGGSAAGDVARVQFQLTSVQRIGRYSATKPLQYGRTPVRVSVAHGAASGAGVFYLATRGYVDVKAFGAGRAAKGTYGTVDADLILRGGQTAIHLEGTWVC